MPPSVEQHAAFWRSIAKDLDGGQPLTRALEHAGSRVEGAELQAAADAVIQDITAGFCLSEAMRKHPSVFSHCATLMARAGEAGGVLDVIAGRIADGLHDGSFPLPGAAKADDPVRYWRAFGRLLSSGVPILEALALLREELCGPRLDQATEAIVQAIAHGRGMADGMQAAGDVFPNEVCFAVLQGERQGSLDEQAFRIADALETADLASLVPEGYTPQTVEASDQASSIVKMVGLILTQAVRDKASDIHFEPVEEGLKVRYRIDGVLYEVQPPPPDLAGHIINRLKIMGNMDIAERRLPQDARIHLDINGKPYDLRVSTVPTIHGERLAVRILDREAVCLDLERIGFPPDDLAMVRELCHLPNGILISNGPAGSGKTTLLYAMLSEVNDVSRCILTAEDPVEYYIGGTAQIQINPKRGLTYARALRSILRQDPDVIMVGELRDLETIQVTVQCSLTGHLLMTTMHTNSSPDALRRLLDVGLEPFLINSTIAGVISQRLVRRLCPECRREAEPPLDSLPPRAVEFVRGLKGATFFVPGPERGDCDRCHGTGFRGRTAIHEILVPDDRVRKAVAASADLATIRNAALAAGMKPMVRSGLGKAAAGVTSVQEVCRVLHLASGW